MAEPAAKQALQIGVHCAGMWAADPAWNDGWRLRILV
jgi:hypothetical protein